MTIRLRIYGTQEDRWFAPSEVQRAASHIGMLTVDEFEVVVNCVQHEHVFRVYRVKVEIDNHPVEHHDGMPPAVTAAIVELRSFEEFMKELRVERLPPEVVLERMTAMSGVD